MKKALILLLSLILFVSVVSCGKGEKSTYESVLKQLKDTDYDVFEFDRATIEINVMGHKENGISFEGRVQNIAQVTKHESTTNVDGFYMFEFELEKDATTFYEKYAKFFAKSRISGEVVIYGVADIIDDFDM